MTDPAAPTTPADYGDPTLYESVGMKPQCTFILYWHQLLNHLAFDGVNLDLYRGWIADIEAEAARSTPAEPLDVERLTKAMDFDRVEALSIIEKHGFVFTTDLSKPIENRTDAERWEALAFRLYTMLLPSNRRSERIIAEYARLPEGADR